MGLRGFIARKIVYTFILIIVVLIVNFTIFYLLGDPVSILASERRLTPEKVQALIHRLGLDQPVHIRFFKYLYNMFTWEFGISYYSQNPVADEILIRLPNTMLLIGTATLFALMFGIVIGIYAAARRGSRLDFAAVWNSLLFSSLPTFWTGIILLYLFGFVFRFFPFAGTISFPVPSDPLALMLDLLWHLFLPGLVLFLFTFGSHALIARGAMLDAMTEDYILTARAKGVDERTVIFRHAFRNALLPVATNVGLSLAGVISGAIITETVFSWTGMGYLTVRSIFFTDTPVLQAVFYVYSLITILAVLLLDVFYAFIDPRIKYT